jgi:outer membrane protein OmpA-like peptidoglycan-associated protein
MKWLELSFPLSLMNNYGDFAFGTMLKLGPVFVGSDNIGGFVNSGKPFGTNVYAGMALPIFKGKKKDKDKDGVSNRKDECKKVAGVWEFRGCPDSDGDGVQDSQDACPSLAGLASLKGCPDTDNDGIADSDDKCPAEAGLGKFGGCPDTDGDNIIDSEDNCPSIAGLAQFNGCPDTDGDNIPDKEDSCPEIKGLPQFKGCPDKDGDGLSDKEDRCPEVAGSIQNKGCPDTDNDGIVDMDDECPSQAGSAQLKGCPDRDMDNVADHKDQCPDTFGTVENKGCPLVKEPETIKVVQLTTEEAKVLKEAFNNLEFETGKAVLKSTSLSSLEELAELLNAKPAYRLLVSGHTDNVGNAAANVKLSKSRADAIKIYLVGKGVATDKVITEGFGAKKPIASNTTEAGRQKNRRVEMKVIK